jgi:hypothetical protein
LLNSSCDAAQVNVQAEEYREPSGIKEESVLRQLTRAPEQKFFASFFQKRSPFFFF